MPHCIKGTSQTRVKKNNCLWAARLVLISSAVSHIFFARPRFFFYFLLFFCYFLGPRLLIVTPREIMVWCLPSNDADTQCLSHVLINCNSSAVLSFLIQHLSVSQPFTLRISPNTSKLQINSSCLPYWEGLEMNWLQNLYSTSPPRLSFLYIWTGLFNKAVGSIKMYILCCDGEIVSSTRDAGEEAVRNTSTRCVWPEFQCWS